MTHLKINYEEIKDYRDDNFFYQVIKVKGTYYTIKRIPRPCKTEKELRLVIVDGITYPNFGNFLRSL